MLRIKEIQLIQNNDEVSAVSFDDGFNVVYGPSNTGKSVILDCIDFIFGAKKEVNPHFNAKEIKARVECDDGYAVLLRSIGKKTLVVAETNIQGLECREYKQKDEKGMSYSDVLLRLIGFTERVEILKNENWEKNNLTFRTFSHTFVIKENDVSKEESILAPEQNTSATSFKSALIYLLSRDNHIDPEGNPIEKAARKKALEKYLKEQVEKLTEKLKSYEGFKIGEPEQFKKDIDELIKKLNEANEELNKKIEESKGFSNQIIGLNDRIAELNNFIEKYNTLLSQYESDLRRMELIVDGKAHSSDVEEPQRCPFCNGKLEKKEEETCEEAAEAELKKLVPQIKDLKEAKKAIEDELASLKEKVAELVGKKKAIDAEINHELKPLVKQLQSKINSYQTAVVSEAEYNNAVQNLNDAIEEHKKVEKIKVEITKYNPREYIESLLSGFLVTKAKAGIDRCNGRENEIDFVYGDFDIKINGSEKKYEGEGFKGFYNTILALALQQVLIERGYYKPGLLLVDSPILSLREKRNEELPDQIKKALFTYLKECARDMQIIAIENDIPDIDYEGVNRIEFTKDPNNGRYGFVKNYQD